MASMHAPSALPPNLVVVPFNTSVLEMLQRPIEFALAAAGAKEVWFVFPESHLVEFYGSEGKRAVTQFCVDLTEFWHSY